MSEDKKIPTLTIEFTPTELGIVVLGLGSLLLEPEHKDQAKRDLKALSIGLNILGEKGTRDLLLKVHNLFNTLKDEDVLEEINARGKAKELKSH